MGGEVDFLPAHKHEGFLQDDSIIKVFYKMIVSRWVCVAIQA